MNEYDLIALLNCKIVDANTLIPSEISIAQRRKKCDLIIEYTNRRFKFHEFPIATDIYFKFIELQSLNDLNPKRKIINVLLITQCRLSSL